MIGIYEVICTLNTIKQLLFTIMDIPDVINRHLLCQI